MAWATTVYSPPNLRLSDSAWPTLLSACLLGYTRSSSRGQIRIRGPTTKVHQTPTSPRISSQPKLNWFSQCSRGSRFIGSRAPGPQRLSEYITSSHSLVKYSASQRRPSQSVCPSSQRKTSSSRKRAFRHFLSGYGATDDGWWVWGQFVAF